MTIRAATDRQGFAVTGASALSPASEIGDQLTHCCRALTRLLDFAEPVDRGIA